MEATLIAYVFGDVSSVNSHSSLSQSVCTVYNSIASRIASMPSCHDSRPINSAPQLYARQITRCHWVLDELQALSVPKLDRSRPEA